MRDRLSECGVGVGIIYTASEDAQQSNNGWAGSQSHKRPVMRDVRVASKGALGRVGRRPAQLPRRPFSRRLRLPVEQGCDAPAPPLRDCPPSTGQEGRHDGYITVPSLTEHWTRVVQIRGRGTSWGTPRLRRVRAPEGPLTATLDGGLSTQSACFFPVPSAPSDLGA